MFYFHHLIEYAFIVSLLSLQNVCVFDAISIISFCSHVNQDQLEDEETQRWCGLRASKGKEVAGIERAASRSSRKGKVVRGAEPRE